MYHNQLILISSYLSIASSNVNITSSSVNITSYHVTAASSPYNVCSQDDNIDMCAVDQRTNIIVLYHKVMTVLSAHKESC